jgi:hypothetical protein
MNPGFLPCPSPVNWKSLYRAAILESNPNLIAQRVSDAEQAVLARGRELFHQNAAPEEHEALEDALYALRAFRTALQNAEQVA